MICENPTLNPARDPAHSLTRQLMQTTDQEIWASVLGGNESSWRTLVDRHQKLVLAIAKRTGLSDTESRDCFQQTWTLLYENREKITEPARISSWLATTARREGLKIRAARGEPDQGTDHAETIDPAPLADEELEKIERQALLELALGELNPRCRTLIEALFFAPATSSYQTIAQELGISVNSMGSNRQRCLESLKEILLRQRYPSTDSG